MSIYKLTRRRYLHTAFFAFLMCATIVGGTAVLGRVTLNLSAALTDKPDIAIYLLLPEEELGQTTLLRELEDERHYYAETAEGPKIVKLQKVDGEWTVESVEKLRE